MSDFSKLRECQDMADSILYNLEKLTTLTMPGPVWIHFQAAIHLAKVIRDMDKEKDDD